MLDNKSKKIILLCGLLFLVALSSFVFGDVHKFSKNNEVKKISNEFSGVVEKIQPQKQIKIYVTGEVVKPGIYDVDKNIRALDVIKLAGGFTENADIEKVNLTKILRDGTQIKVPALKKNSKIVNINLQEKSLKQRSFKHGAPPNIGTNQTLNLQNASVTVVELPDDFLINLNFASEREIARLPGIYSELAKRIVNYRNNNLFRSSSDLLKVRGMNEQKIQQIKKYITFK